MTSKGNRRNGQPFLIKENKANELKHIHLKTDEYNEAWIQELIHDNPNILPINFCFVIICHTDLFLVC